MKWKRKINATCGIRTHVRLLYRGVDHHINGETTLGNRYYYVVSLSGIYVRPLGNFHLFLFSYLIKLMYLNN